MMKSRMIGLAMATATTVLGATTAFPGQAFAASDSPNVVGSNPGWVFEVITNEDTNAIQETGHSVPTQNGTKFTNDWAWSGSYEDSVSASVSASLQAGWGPIEATLGASADLSLSTTYTTSSSFELPPGYWAWVRFGYVYNKVYGEYAYQNQNGSLSNVTDMTVTSPQYTEEQVEDSATTPSNP